MKLFLIFVTLVALWLPSTADATVCKVRVDRVGLPAPDNAWNCTPGAFQRLSKAQVCNGSNRPSLRAAVRREVLTEYQVPNWTGVNGEIDHRVPVFLGGLTVAANLWPEPGSIPNLKDRLEFRVYRMVCFADPSPLRVRTARRIFLADWRHTYRSWVEDGIITVAGG